MFISTTFNPVNRLKQDTILTLSRKLFGNLKSDEDLNGKERESVFAFANEHRIFAKIYDGKYRYICFHD